MGFGGKGRDGRRRQFQPGPRPVRARVAAVEWMLDHGAMTAVLGPVALTVDGGYAPAGDAVRAVRRGGRVRWVPEPRGPLG